MEIESWTSKEEKEIAAVEERRAKEIAAVQERRAKEIAALKERREKEIAAEEERGAKEMEILENRRRELLAELSDEEKARFPPLQMWTPLPRSGGWMTNDKSLMPIVHAAISYYNDKHPGFEFDVFHPLTEAIVRFQDHPWLHINFLARSRSSRKIKRFFAEVWCHREIVTVEACTIIEEPLHQHRTSCAFCPIKAGVLHPTDDTKFTCGSGSKGDWMIETGWGRLRFLSHCPKSQEFEDEVLSCLRIMFA